MRPYILLLALCFILACKKKESPIPPSSHFTGTIEPRDSVPANMEVWLNGIADHRIDANNNITTRWSATATFRYTDTNTGILSFADAGNVSYNNTMLNKTTVSGGVVYTWPDSSLPFTLNGAWHITDNNYFDAVSYADTLSYPFVTDFPDTIHRYGPQYFSYSWYSEITVFLSADDKESTPDWLYVLSGSAGVNAGIPSLIADTIPDSVYVTVRLELMPQEFLAEPVHFRKYSLWSKWVTVID